MQRFCLSYPTSYSPKPPKTNDLVREQQDFGKSRRPCIVYLVQLENSYLYATMLGMWTGPHTRKKQKKQLKPRPSSLPPK
jgi:hypothetical protein